jgi:DNA-binding NarL/FixJ family response regulator
MPVATSHETISPLERQMELPIAALLRRRAAFSRRARYPRVRGDMLPERTRYQDDGCEIHPECLTCPLPRCRYDEPGGLNGMLTRMRDREVVRLRAKGAPVEEIADVFGVSRRTVFRILTAKYKEVRCA